MGLFSLAVTANLLKLNSTSLSFERLPCSNLNFISSNFSTANPDFTHSERKSIISPANLLAQDIPNSVFTVHSGKVTHMTLLNEGTEEGKKSIPEYTCDHPSINRAKIHKEIGALAVDFFNQYLSQSEFSGICEDFKG